jgi:hypothetical protein
MSTFRRLFLGTALLLALIDTAYSQNSPQQTANPQSAQRPATDNNRGTEQTPFFVKIIPAPKTEAEARQEAQDRKEKFYSDTWLIRWTGAVAVFTLVLGGIGAWQGIQLKRSVDLLSQSERAQMFIVVHRDWFEMISQAAKRYPNTPDMDNSEVSESSFVSYNFKNYGKTPAIIKEISAMFFVGSKPPSEPVYIPNDDILKESMIASGDVTAIADSTRDILTHYCKFKTAVTLAEAKEIVRAQSYIWFFGRILYEDIFGRKHEHRFLWRYGGAHGFRPNYEYPKYTKNS